MLEVRGLRASYGHGDVLHGIDLSIPAGSVTALIGANGAGKSTLMRCLAGLHRPVAGSIALEGREIQRLGAEGVVRLGMALVPEGRKVFGPLSVAENLEMGAFTALVKGDTTRYRERLDFVLTMFPVLAERRAQLAGTLSGGEQQMLAIARALMSAPRLLLLDEPSMGIAPIVVRQIFETLSALRASGLTIVICEQNSDVALRRADAGLVLEEGHVVLAGTGAALLEDPRVKEAYLGV